jgi:hypothetical protein
MKSFYLIFVILLVALSFSLNINGGMEFQTTLTPFSTPFLTLNKNNAYLNIYGDTSDTIKYLGLTLSIADKVYLNSFKISSKINGLNSTVYIKDKGGESQDWLNLISSDKLGNNYMGLLIQSDLNNFFYALPDFSDTSTKYKTFYFQQRLNYKNLFSSLLYSSRSSDLKTTYEDLYAADFTYKMDGGFIKGELGYVDSNDNKGYDILNRSFIMLGYKSNDNDYITYTQFSKGFNYSISSYQPMFKGEFKFGNLNGWYYKNLKIGGKYQPVIEGDKVKFSYYDPYASSVNLAGSFNGWSKDANPMVKNSDGVWTLEISLSPGTYQYKYVVNGSSWVEDPYGFDYTDDGFGGLNSVITLIQGKDGNEVIATPKDKFLLSYSSPIIGNISIESNLRDEINQTGNYLYKVNYSKDFGYFGISTYIGYPEDLTNISSPDSYSLLVYKNGKFGDIAYNTGFKPLLFSPNFTDTKGYINLSYGSSKLNFTLFSNNSYSVYAETNIPFKYGNVYLKGLTDFKDFNLYANVNINVFSPAIVQLSVGNSDFDTYKQFSKEISLYVKTTF